MPKPTKKPTSRTFLNTKAGTDAAAYGGAPTRFTDAKMAGEALAGTHWVKAIVTYANIYHLQVGLPLCMKLVRTGIAKQLYYARYTTPPFRLEIQMWTDKSNQELFKAISAYKFQNVRPRGIRFEECVGSMAHAQAFNAVMFAVMENKLTMQQLQDITHWMYNMAGFSYIQEAAAAAAGAYFACRNIQGWSESPVFGTKLVKASDGKQPVKPHRPNPRRTLRRVKA